MTSPIHAPAQAAGPTLVAITLFGLVLASPSLINGYPIVFPDSGTYLAQAIELAARSDRPPYYSLFLFPIHAKLSLWPIPIAQGLFVSTVIYLAIRVCALDRPLAAYAACGAVLAIGTGLPWMTSQIMPDAFTGAAILLAFVVLSGWQHLAPSLRALAWLMLLGTAAFHLTHVPLIAGLLCLHVARQWRAQSLRGALSAPQVSAVAFAILAASFAFLLYGFVLTGRATVSPDGPKVLLARSIYDGPAAAHLDDVCSLRPAPYRFCAYLDRLPPDQDGFLWGAASPWPDYEKALGFNASRDEARRIVADTLVSRPMEQALASARNFLRQLATFQSLDTLCPCRGEIQRVVAEHFANEIDAYSSSAQFRDSLPLREIRGVHTVVIVGSLFCLLYLVGFRGNLGRYFSARPGQAGALFQLVLVGVLMNAALTGVLSGVFDRYQARVVWLLPFLCIVLWFDFRPPRAVLEDGMR